MQCGSWNGLLLRGDGDKPAPDAAAGLGVRTVRRLRPDHTPNLGANCRFGNE